ncbi:MAG: VanZ family protein [Woeseiaceae bacterium]
MLPLQHASLWRVLSIVLLLVVLAGTLTPTFWLDNRAKALSLFAHTDKWLHGLTFAFLALWFGGLVARHRYWVIALGLFAFGLVVEGCQLLVRYRMAEWLDVVANTVGIVGGLLVAAAGVGGWALWLEERYSRYVQH